MLSLPSATVNTVAVISQTHINLYRAYGRTTSDALEMGLRNGTLSEQEFFIWFAVSPLYGLLLRKVELEKLPARKFTTRIVGNLLRAKGRLDALYNASLNWKEISLPSESLEALLLMYPISNSLKLKPSPSPTAAELLFDAFYDSLIRKKHRQFLRVIRSLLTDLQDEPERAMELMTPQFIELEMQEYYLPGTAEA